MSAEDIVIGCDADALRAAVGRVWNRPVTDQAIDSFTEPAAKAAQRALETELNEARAVEVGEGIRPALDKLQRSLSTHGPLLRTDDPTLIDATIQLCRWMLRSGDASSAQRTAAALLDAHTLAGGYIDDVVASVAYELGLAYLGTRALTTALPLFARSAAAYLLTVGPDDWRTIRGQAQVAEIGYAVGQFAACDNALSSVQLPATALYPEAGSLLLDASLAFVRAMRLGGRLPEARALLVDAAMRWMASRCSPSIHRAGIFHQLSLCEWALGEGETATTHGRQARADSVGLEQTEAAELAAAIVANLGFDAMQRGTNAEGFELLTEANRLESTLPHADGRPSIAALYLSAFAGTKSCDTALAQLRSAEPWFRRWYGPSHPCTAALRNDIAVVLARAGQWKAAGELLNEMVLTGGFGVEGRDLMGARIGYNASVVAAVLGRADAARILLDKVTASISSLADHPLHLRACAQVRQWEHSSSSQKSLDATLAGDQLVVLPLAE